MIARLLQGDVSGGVADKEQEMSKPGDRDKQGATTSTSRGANSLASKPLSAAAAATPP